MKRFCLNTNKMKPKLQTSPITIMVFGTLTGVIFLSIYVRFERGGIQRTGRNSNVKFKNTFIFIYLFIYFHTATWHMQIQAQKQEIFV